MILEGRFPDPPEAALFADTGDEPAAVYRHLEWLRQQAAAAGFPVHIVRAGNLREDLEAAMRDGINVRHPPFWTRTADGRIGALYRKCTEYYKLEPIERWCRTAMGYGPRERVRHTATLWLGISLDEVQRMHDARHRWVRNRYPLIELRLTRDDLLTWYERRGYPTPPKSACAICPYRNTRNWATLREQDPAAWQEAVEMDTALRRGFHTAEHPLTAEEVYLWSKARPLVEVPTLPALDAAAQARVKQLDLFQEEPDWFDGSCDSGFCGI